jgi:hypothetical protein
LPGFLISNGKKGKESGIETERECVREAECCDKRQIASPIKLTIKG